MFSIRFADKQIVRLQETPDEIPDGGTPHTVSLLLHDKLVDSGKPGDRVEVSTYWSIIFVTCQCIFLPHVKMCSLLLLLQVTGIYRAMSVRVGPTQRTVKSLFKVCVQYSHPCFNSNDRKCLLS